MEYSGRHTYLFDKGIWRAIGTYFDKNGEPVSVIGESSINIQKKIWTLEGFMELQMDKPIKMSSRYQIKPFEKNKDHTSWVSDNPDLGIINGHFILVNDIILSQYRSEDNQYSGAEILLFIDDDQYQNWGALFKGSDKMSSWEVMLERMP